MWKIIKKILRPFEKPFYYPGDWLVTHLSARDRRAIATWLAIFFLVSTPIQYPYRNAVWLVWLLSELALVLSMLGVVSAETPVEAEDESKSDHQESR